MEETRNEYKALPWKLDGKGGRRRWERNIRMDRNDKIWIHLAKVGKQ
jgi:hypothetical protein